MLNEHTLVTTKQFVHIGLFLAIAYRQQQKDYVAAQSMDDPKWNHLPVIAQDLVSAAIAVLIVTMMCPRLLYQLDHLCHHL